MVVAIGDEHGLFLIPENIVDPVVVKLVTGFLIEVPLSLEFHICNCQRLVRGSRQDFQTL